MGQATCATVLVAILFSAGGAAADEPAAAPAAEEPKEPTGPKRADECSVRYSYANDAPTGADYYFTQGMTLAWRDPNLTSWPLALPVPRVEDDALARETWFWRYDGFTPIEYEDPAIQVGDRPFAAYMYVGHRTESLASDGTNTLWAQWVLGYLGPAVLGGEFQNEVHRNTGGANARGWQNQIDDDLIVQLDAGYTHRLVRAGDVFDAQIELELRGGTLYSDGALGGRLRLGLLESPATTPGLGQFHFWVAVQGRAGGYTAPLVGGVLNDSVYTLSANDLERFVATGQVGLKVELGAIGLEVSWNWTSPEFEGARSHRWVLLALTVYY
jgi:lipid A 3-O-deacylase